MARLDMGGVAFAALALLTLGSAGVVARGRNVVHSVVALLGTIVGVAGLCLLLAADFVAAMQLVVFAGGTLVLFLFAAMLTTPKSSASSSNAPRARRLAAMVTFVLAGAFSAVAIDTVWPTQDLASVPSTAKLGAALLGEHLLPFELASLVFFAAMIGAVTAFRADRAELRSDPPSRRAVNEGAGGAAE